jgi:sarcosine oxidase, subunit gamma
MILKARDCVRNDVRQESPLIGLAQALKSAVNTRALRIQEKPLLEFVNLRGDLRSTQFVSAVQQALAMPLPSRPNTVTQGSTHAALWLGPDEWLLQSAEPRNAKLARMMGSSLAGQVAAAVDVSSSYTVLELSGDRARAVIQTGCPLDLHPRVFAVGKCAQSHFFRAPVVLRPVGADAYELVLRRSYADYAARMVLDAGEEFRFRQ